MKKILILLTASIFVIHASYKDDDVPKLSWRDRILKLISVIPIKQDNQTLEIPANLSNPPQVMVINDLDKNISVRFDYSNHSTDKFTMAFKDIPALSQELVPVQTELLSGPARDLGTSSVITWVDVLKPTSDRVYKSLTLEEIKLLNTGKAFIKITKDEANKTVITIGSEATEVPEAPPAPFSAQQQAESKLVKAGAYSSSQ